MNDCRIDVSPVNYSDSDFGKKTTPANISIRNEVLICPRMMTPAAPNQGG